MGNSWQFVLREKNIHDKFVFNSWQFVLKPKHHSLDIIQYIEQLSGIYRTI